MHGSLERHSPPPLSTDWLRSTQQPESDGAGDADSGLDIVVSCQQRRMTCAAGLHPLWWNGGESVLLRSMAILSLVNVAR